MYRIYKRGRFQNFGKKWYLLEEILWLISDAQDWIQHCFGRWEDEDLGGITCMEVQVAIIVPVTKGKGVLFYNMSGRRVQEICPLTNNLSFDKP